MQGKQTRLLRWATFGIVAAVGGWLTYLIGGVVLDSYFAGSLGILIVLAGLYSALAVGYLFAAFVSRVAPGRRYQVAVSLVFIMVAVAAALMLRNRSSVEPLPGVLLGLSLVVGSVGYALRVRGFTEAVTGREP